MNFEENCSSNLASTTLQVWHILHGFLGLQIITVAIAVLFPMWKFYVTRDFQFQRWMRGHRTTASPYQTGFHTYDFHESEEMMPGAPSLRLFSGARVGDHKPQ